MISSAVCYTYGMTLSQAFMNRISELLVANNMSKYRLEKESGLTHSALRHIFNGNNKDVSMSSVAKVAKVFNMTMGEFMTSPIFALDQIDYE